jgi:hypothetical protein
MSWRPCRTNWNATYLSHDHPHCWNAPPMPHSAHIHCLLSVNVQQCRCQWQHFVRLLLLPVWVARQPLLAGTFNLYFHTTSIRLKCREPTYNIWDITFRLPLVVQQQSLMQKYANFTFSHSWNKTDTHQTRSTPWNIRWAYLHIKQAGCRRTRGKSITSVCYVTLGCEHELFLRCFSIRVILGISLQHAFVASYS